MSQCSDDDDPDWLLTGETKARRRRCFICRQLTRTPAFPYQNNRYNRASSTTYKKRNGSVMFPDLSRAVCGGCFRSEFTERWFTDVLRKEKNVVLSDLEDAPHNSMPSRYHDQKRTIYKRDLDELLASDELCARAARKLYMQTPEGKRERRNDLSRARYARKKRRVVVEAALFDRSVFMPHWAWEGSVWDFYDTGVDVDWLSEIDDWADEVSVQSERADIAAWRCAAMGLRADAVGAFYGAISRRSIRHTTLPHTNAGAIIDFIRTGAAWITPEDIEPDPLLGIPILSTARWTPMTHTLVSFSFHKAAVAETVRVMSRFGLGTDVIALICEKLTHVNRKSGAAPVWGDRKPTCTKCPRCAGHGTFSLKCASSRCGVCCKGPCQFHKR